MHVVCVRYQIYDNDNCSTAVMLADKWTPQCGVVTTPQILLHRQHHPKNNFVFLPTFTSAFFPRSISAISVLPWVANFPELGRLSRICLRALSGVPYCIKELRIGIDCFLGGVITNI